MPTAITTTPAKTKDTDLEAALLAKLPKYASSSRSSEEIEQNAYASYSNPFYAVEALNALATKIDCYIDTTTGTEKIHINFGNRLFNSADPLFNS